MKSRFIYHGEVVACGARLDSPRLRHAKGAVALPGIGGRVRASAESSELGHLLRFEYATSSVSGEHRGDGFETRAACTVEGLEIPGLLRADLLSSTLTSRYVDEHVFHEESVLIEGLWIRDREYVVDAENLERIRECPTWDKVREAAAERTGLAAAFARGGAPVPTRAGNYACYLLEAHPPGAKDRPAPSLSVPAGATTFEIFIGEYLIAERQRRLTLLRVEARRGESNGPVGKESAGALMGAPPAPELEGSLVVAESIINGQTHP